MSLARMLYRQMMRRAREHDRHPALKALLVNPQRQTAWQRLEARLSEGGSGSSGGGKSDPEVILIGSGTGSQFVQSILRAAVQRAQKRLSKSTATPAAATGSAEEAETKGTSTDDDDGSIAKSSKHEASSPAHPANPATDALSRWLTDFFRGRDYYLPLPPVSMEAIVRKEFRLPLPLPPPPQTATPAAAPVAAASSKRSSAASASSAATHSPPPLTQLTNKAFEILRTLNRNHAEGAKRQLMLREQDVLVDPAFQPEIAPRPPASLLQQQQQQRKDDAADSVTDASSLPDGFRMKPTTHLRAGTFLVAHPQLDESTFGRTVILLTRTASSPPASSSSITDDDRSGAAGFVINTPFRLLNTLGDKMPKRLKLADPLRLLKSCALQDGGPVTTPLISNVSSSASGNSGHSISFGLSRSPPQMLHRLPLLAAISTPVISEGAFPVWMLEANKMEQAAALIENEINAATAATTASANSAAIPASSSDPASPASAASPAPPAASAVFTASDIVGYTGCAEWAPGQLEDEIARGSWMLAEGSGAHVFASPATDAEFAAAEANGNAAENQEESKAAGKKAAAARRKKKVIEAAAIDGASAATAASWPFSPLPNRPERPFLQSRVWAHAMHVHGGEARHWAHMPNPNGAQSDSGAIINELLAGRRQ